MEILQKLEQEKKRVADEQISELNGGSKLPQMIEESIEILLKAIKEFGEDIALSFNGGKDCTVVLHLLRAACAIKDSEECASLNQDSLKTYIPWIQRIKYVHFVKDNEFPEIQEFREQIEQAFDIHIQLFSANFKEEVQKLIDSENVKAIIMGNRRSDPWSRDLETVCKSSPGWPDFYRVFPILDWGYHNVWEFLRSYEQLYCKLYDQGYTSLGEMDNTIKNPQLQVLNPVDGALTYLPAYALKSEEHERDSRVPSKK